MTPKVIYTLNDVDNEKVFAPEEYTSFSQKWVRDEIEYKHPFTGVITRKCRGYYYQATLTFEAVPYDAMVMYRDILYTKVQNLRFFPNKDSVESYLVDVNAEFAYDDAHVYLAHQNFELVFRGKERFEHPLNYPQIYWGARRVTWNDIGSKSFEEIV